MKKIYIFLLLIINAVSISCMKMEQKPKPLFPENPYADPTKLSSHSITLAVNNNIPVHIEANESGWEKYNDIMNVTYQRDSSITKNEFELTPIYRPEATCIKNIHRTRQSIETEEKEPFLHGIKPVEYNTDLMQTLFEHAVELITYYKTLDHQNHIINGIIKNQNLYLLINKMNDAKNKGINEHMMEKFAHDQPSSFFNAYPNHITLVFNCLKRYSITTEDTTEQAPNYQHLTSYATLTQYPAYAALADSITWIIRMACWDINNGFSFLSSQKEDPLSNVYDDLTSDFYNTASTFLCSPTRKGVYDLLHMIDQAKIKKDIIKEKDLGYAILESEPTTVFNFLLNIVIKKKTISLLCELIEQYNKARSAKITPLNKNYCCFKLKRRLNLVLPDTFNSALLDENIYAFIELAQLLDNITELQELDKQSIQLRADELYPPRK